MAKQTTIEKIEIVENLISYAIGKKEILCLYKYAIIYDRYIHTLNSMVDELVEVE